MHQPDARDPTLDDIRREIDAIDAALLDLLGRRFAASEAVRAIKARSAEGLTQPIRPGREAAVLRRLLERRPRPVPARLVVRLWRELMTASTLVQAEARVHCPAALIADAALRDQVRDHFGAIPIVAHPTCAAALAALGSGEAGIAAVPVAGDWLQPLVDGVGGPAQVIGVLPGVAAAGPPSVLLIGLAPAEATGADETLVAVPGRLPGTVTARWQAEAADGRRLASLAGFLSERDGPLAALRRNDGLALTVLGRYPSPLELEVD